MKGRSCQMKLHENQLLSPTHRGGGGLARQVHVAEGDVLSVLVGRPGLLLALLDGCLVQPVGHSFDNGVTGQDCNRDHGGELEDLEAVVAVQCTDAGGHPPKQAKRALASAEQGQHREISHAYRARCGKRARYLIPSTTK